MNIKLYAKLGERWLHRDEFICEIIEGGALSNSYTEENKFPKFKVIVSFIAGQHSYPVGYILTTNVGANPNWILLKGQDKV